MPRKPKKPSTPAPSPQREVIHSAPIERVPVGAIRPHPKNPRRGNVKAIIDSIRQNGFHGSIIVSRVTGHILAGNHRYQALVQMGEAEVPVQYIDSLTPEQEARIVLADNRTSDVAEYDNKALEELLSGLKDTDYGLSGTGYDASDLDSLLAELSAPGGGSIPPEEKPAQKHQYSRKIEAPVYRPTLPAPPALSLLYNDEKCERLVREIDASDQPEDIKRFLRAAATRHVRFHFQNIAEFYAHASPELQRLMEDSVLVIIDFNKAIEQGFVELTEDLLAMQGKDYPEGYLVPPGEGEPSDGDEE